MAEQRPATFDRSQHAPVPLWRDIRVIQVVAQVAFLAAVIVFFYVLLNNMVNNLEKSQLAINFGMMERSFGTQISEGQMDFDPGTSSNLKALWIGLQNTLR
ncbi:MAG: hypothetical protein JW910_11965, partial [Anaerolineae bacterium]|nr:hypothetical protein [Anaerolineae bacterium]